MFVLISISIFLFCKYIQWSIAQPGKQWNNAICSNMDGPRDYPIIQRKSDRNKRCITHMQNSLAFSMIQYMLAVWSLVPLPFLNPAFISGSSWFTNCWNLAWSILSVIWLAYEMNATVWQFELCLACLFFANGMETDLFQYCGHCWVFQICWHSEWSNLTASPFRICNSSAGIPSLPLVLFVVMLPKAQLASHFWF